MTPTPYPNLSAVFEAFNQLKVMIIGDVMLDAYLWGKVERISPEAPVPIVAVQKRENRLGGAANVAINIRALGATPILCSVIGNDTNGELLVRLLKDLGMSAEGMVTSDERVTTVKTRIIGNNHQLLRVDDEVQKDLSMKEQDGLFKNVSALIHSHRPDVVIFEDYDKGVLGEDTISKIVSTCKEQGIPTAVDPKKKNFLSYKGVNLFKPNLSELKSGLKSEVVNINDKDLHLVTDQFRTEYGIDTLLVTLSENGVYYGNDSEHNIIPAHIRNISDVSGAGDTVISVASLCLALGLSTRTTAALANLAGGLVCEKVGVVPIDKKQLFEEANGLKP